MWRPIDTAPRDGTRILWTADNGEWNKPAYDVVWWPTYKECFDVGRWMPLPPVEPSVFGEIAAERRRQIEEEGFTPEHDDHHDDGSLVMAAITYAMPRHLAFRLRKHSINTWPWQDGCKFKGERRDLVRAAALIIAEIERLDREQEHSA